MRTKVQLMSVVLSLAVTSSGSVQDPRLGLSGIWSGLRNQIPLSGCEKADDGDTPAALTLRVEENGVVTGKDSGGRRFTGNIADDMSLSLQMNGLVKCSNDQQPHTRTTAFSGQITRGSGAPSFVMSGVEQPCPPSCSFNVTYSLERTR